MLTLLSLSKVLSRKVADVKSQSRKCTKITARPILKNFILDSTTHPRLSENWCDFLDICDFTPPEVAEKSQRLTLLSLSIIPWLPRILLWMMKSSPEQAEYNVLYLYYNVSYLHYNVLYM